MLKQVHFKCTLHLERLQLGRYRQIAVVEQADHFELRIFEGVLPKARVRKDPKTVGLHPTLDGACTAADEEMRKSLAAGWVLLQSVKKSRGSIIHEP
jgi:hypothetical protein